MREKERDALLPRADASSRLVRHTVGSCYHAPRIDFPLHLVRRTHRPTRLGSGLVSAVDAVRPLTTCETIFIRHYYVMSRTCSPTAGVSPSSYQKYMRPQCQCTAPHLGASVDFSRASLVGPIHLSLRSQSESCCDATRH